MRSPPGSGSLGLTNWVENSKYAAPIAMANANASPPTSVSPGYFTSIRKPRRKSSDIPATHASPRASRTSSRCFSTPPKVIAARRRASAGPSPSSRISRSASISR
jgi:hypothetical protein